jgi:hypothetical protein
VAALRARHQLPKAQGFPAEPLTDGSDNEYDYYFKEVRGHFRSIGNRVAETGTSLYVTVNAWFPTGNSFPIPRRHRPAVQRRR